MPTWIPYIIIFIVGVVFNAGGFVWLARNHFAHVNARLDRLELTLATRLSAVEQRIARLEGALLFPRTLTEN